MIWIFYNFLKYNFSYFFWLHSNEPFFFTHCWHSCIFLHFTRVLICDETGLVQIWNCPSCQKKSQKCYQPLSCYPPVLPYFKKKNTPSGLNMPNRKVDVALWPLLKHREVGVQRSELVSAFAPHWVWQVWFGCASRLWFLRPDPLKYPALTSSSIPTSHSFCTSTPKPTSSQAMFNLISHSHLACLSPLCFHLE